MDINYRKQVRPVGRMPVLLVGRMLVLLLLEHMLVVVVVGRMLLVVVAGRMLGVVMEHMLVQLVQHKLGPGHKHHHSFSYRHLCHRLFH